MADTITRNDTVYNEDLLDEDDRIQHGIDNDPHDDAEKGATLGGVGGAVVGAVAGAMAGPLGAIAGAVIGGVVGGVASGAAVGAIDRHDNDNTISGIGREDPYYNSVDDEREDLDAVPVSLYATTSVVTTGVPGVVTEEYETTYTNATRYAEDENDEYAIPSDLSYDTNSVRNGLDGETDRLPATARVGVPAPNSGIGSGFSREDEVGESQASFKTGGVANDGTPDTRGIGEKFADAITGDDVDDKTGKVVDHP